MARNSGQACGRAEEKRLADEAAALAQRVKEQRPAPRSEAALRRNIEELRRGQPDYSQMSTTLADVTRQQLVALKDMVVKMGAVQSVTFKGVGPGGRDIYEVKFENGLTEWRIGMMADGGLKGLASA